jgi:hypothetical protein
VSEDRDWTRPQGERIAADEIRVGDIVERYSGGGILRWTASEGDYFSPDTRWYLVHRPAPAEPTRLGAVVRAGGDLFCRESLPCETDWPWRKGYDTYRWSDVTAIAKGRPVEILFGGVPE